MVEVVVQRLPLLSAAVTAYDPKVDPDGVTLESCLNLIETIAAAAPGARNATSVS